MKLRLTILLVCWLLLQNAAWCFPRIKHLGINEGLSNNSVRCIYRDHKGFMWFGTVDGLNRYDGYNFKVFRNRFKDSGSLPHNFIYAIRENADADLWIATGQGLCRYNYISEDFSFLRYTPYGTHSVKKLTSGVKSLALTSGGDMLVGSIDSGLMVCPKGTDIATQVPIRNGGSLDIRYTVTAIKLGPDKRIWLLIPSYGLCEFDPISRQLTVVLTSLSTATCLAPDGDLLWIGTAGNGILSYQTRSGTLKKILDETTGGLSVGKVTDIYPDLHNDLWIATNGGGVDIFNKDTRKIKYLSAGNPDQSLSSEYAFTIYQDPDKRKWIGTLKGGINVVDPGTDCFVNVSHSPGITNTLVSNYVFSFCESPDGKLWIGADGGGISVWSRDKGQFTNYKHDPADPFSLSDNFVSNIKADRSGNIWIATMYGGINRYDRKTGKFIHYACVHPVTGIEHNMTYTLYVAKDSTVWASALVSGALFRYDPVKDRFEAFDTRLTEVFAINEDNEGVLWVGKLMELVRVDRREKKNQYYEMGFPVRAIYEDHAGHFWVATEGGGLILFDKKTGQIQERYTTGEGLCNNSVHSIQDDGRGNLWLSTFNGLSKFDIAARHFTNYFRNDGLQSSQFNYNAGLTLRSGEMVFGGINGFDLFYPWKIAPVDTRPGLLLTGMDINNIPLDSNFIYLSRKDKEEVREVKVPYDKAVFTFNYAALEYSSPDKIKYAYYMEGWDRGWNTAGNLRTASYTHLDEGHYKFHVKATNTEGVWGSDKILLSVIVLPPWYRSWWAYLIYAGLFGAAVRLYFFYRSRQERLRYAVALANQDAERQKAEKEKERVEHEKRLAFFTNISHEFRTPLTLIINPVKDLLQKAGLMATSVANGELGSVYRNARRLLSLVDQLLLFRKADSGADTIRPVRLDFVHLCREVFLCFDQQARSKKIHYTFECEEEKLEIVGDREKLEIILYNLLSNALKYTPVGGSVTFTLVEKEKMLEISVADTGSGIPPGTGDRLFEKFFQVKDANSKAGFGIGLYLVRHFTEGHKGKISYQSEPGKGTVFALQLPNGAAHFEEALQTDGLAGESLLEELSEESEVSEDSELAGNLIIGQFSGRGEDPGAELMLPSGEEDKRYPVSREEISEDRSAREADHLLNVLVTEKRSILVIDDEAEIRRYVVGLFKADFTVYEAGNGEKGLALARSHLPDIIISDIKMQEMGGIQLCKAVKEDPLTSHIPVVLLTGTDSRESRLEGAEGGADDYITKPFEKELLLARVAALLKSRNTLQKYFFNEITLHHHDLKIPEEYRNFLKYCIDIVEAHLEVDDFTVTTFRQAIGMSHSNFYRKVKSISGLTIIEFIRFIRLRKAAELFINSNFNVNEVAGQVGIGNAKYFREQFHRVFGLNPSDYIKKYRKPFSNQFSVNKDTLGSVKR